MTSPSKTRIAIDMDEVIADALTGMRQWVKTQYGHEWDDDELAGRSLRQLLAEERFEALHAHMHQGEFFRHLTVIEGAQDALRSLSVDHEVFITTAAMEFPLSLQFKWAWLRENFDFLNPLNFVFCGDKSIINADFLIDDNARHFVRFVGQGIVFDAPHNADVTGYPRLNTWDDAAALIENLRRS
jgi:5'(3')-deoxyribonucleotidase